MNLHNKPLSAPVLLSRLCAGAAAALLVACGPGHVPDGVPPPLGGGGAIGTSAQFAQQCSSANPYRGDAIAPPATGSLTTEKQWARAYINEAYLWYDKVPDISAALAKYSNDTSGGFYESIDEYFSDLTVNPVQDDRFSFTFPSKQWRDLSQAGVSLGYGFDFYVGSITPPREYRIAFVDPASAAAAVGVLRGDTVVSIDGVSINDSSDSGIATLSEGLRPSTAGSHTFVFSRNGVNRAPVLLTAASIALSPVPLNSVITSNGAKVGYILFNDHNAPSENQLANAITNMRTQGITDLVLDLRYNGGGYLFIASSLSYMIAGDTRTAGKTFERLQYNDKRSADTQSADATTPFYNELCILDTSNRCTAPPGTPLPALNLSRVYVLAGPGTCSASEAVVNGLRGVDVEVVIIGGTTCGKPYGFTAKDNCGISYFPIEFQGVNAKGFGDYTTGFTPTCQVADDFGHALGDSAEGMLAVALSHRVSGVCPTTGLAKAGEKPGRLLKGPERNNRIVVSRTR